MRALVPPQSFHSVGWEAGCADAAVSIAKPAARAPVREKPFTGFLIAIPRLLRRLFFALASYSAIVRDGENRVEPLAAGLSRQGQSRHIGRQSRFRHQNEM